ncbi:MAG: rhodanese-like domain-containing protein [Planctomycetes bacterium]|nr:rhodanese-like domain-containing protein [Planctomycetota bacterium]MCB9869372.1 rhodanese-like domain-containing protein [Planctomycetota bacterium]
MQLRNLSPAESHAELCRDSDLIVLDVRTQPEFDRYHVDGAVLLPIQELEDRLDELDVTARYVVVCEHGVRSAMACDILLSQGFSDLRNVDGGMARWIGEAVPLLRD